MADQNENIENFEDEGIEFAASELGTDEFTSSIGDALAVEGEIEDEAPVVAPIHEGPIQTVGRRKRAIARVRMVQGSGEITCNGRALEDYFPNKLHQQLIQDPLALLERENQFDIQANINGGGPSGQAGALRLAIARALNLYNPEERGELKKAGFLTRDSRAVERKKAGLHGARRAPQYSKR